MPQPPEFQTVIKQLKETIAQHTETHEAVIFVYKNALHELRKINDTCERCEGTGRILKPRACAEDDRTEITCHCCNGTGCSRPDSTAPSTNLLAPIKQAKHCIELENTKFNKLIKPYQDALKALETIVES